VLGWRVDYRMEPLSVAMEGPLGPGWRVGLILIPFNNALAVAEVKVFPDGDRQRVAAKKMPPSDNRVAPRMWSEDASALDPDHPTITANTLRNIHLPEIIREAQQSWANDLGRTERTQWEEVLGQKPGAIAATFARSLDLERRPIGRPPKSKAARRDVELATVAFHYAEAVGRGSRSPIKDIASKLNLSVTSARDAKFRAVEKGYLTGTQERKAAGALTARAIRILEEAAKEQS
jgi:hypothetical protein